jgi:hypothetical protein
MTSLRMAAAALVAAAATGCGLGAGGADEGTARLLITRDYGAEVLLEASEDDPRASESVLRFLDRETEIETRYGGGFVQSIEGIAGDGSAAGRSDWFFYVNGIESSVGSAEVGVRGGDRIWWDYRNWSAAMRVPAVVGQWPEPFAQESTDAENRHAVEIVCDGARAACRLARRRVDAVSPATADAETGEGPRVLVGPWSRLRSDPVAALLRDGPAAGGVFADFGASPGGSGAGLIALDEGGDRVRRLGAEAGLVAALRSGDDPPTWVVTGGTRSGVALAARSLDSTHLAHRYAVAALPGETVPLPLPVEEAG